MQKMQTANPKVHMQKIRGISLNKALIVIAMIAIILGSYFAWKFDIHLSSGGTSNDESSSTSKGSLEIHVYEDSTEVKRAYSLRDNAGKLVTAGITPATIFNLTTGDYTVSVTHEAHDIGETVHVLENQIEKVNFKFQKTFSNIEESLPLTEDLAPSFSLMDINGTLFDINEYKGKVIAIHFMLVYCGGGITNYNNHQLEELKALCNKYSQNDLVIITAAYAFCSHYDIVKIRNDYNITWFLGVDESMNILSDYSKTYFAALNWKKGDGTIVLIDKKSHTRYLCWDIEASRLSDKINELKMENG